MMNDRISIDPNVCHGQSVVKGTRIPVEQIAKMLRNGDTIDDLLREYPSLEPEDVTACVDLWEKEHLKDEFKNYKKHYPKSK
jgi:uncharacterized protein (DUF433 family)